MVKTTSTPSLSAAADDLVFLNEQEANDSSFWEFINQSDADSDTDSLWSIENGFLSWSNVPAPPRPRSSNSNQEIETHVVIEGQDAVDAADFTTARVEIPDDSERKEEGKQGKKYENRDGDEEHERNDDLGYGLDDELVPWNVAGKFGRERMRKLGKRLCSKMVNSKRNPYAFVKPGCVHGKHGLGMKA